MPYSYYYFKESVKEHFLKTFTPDLRILDVGPGAGKYAKLLSPPFELDAVEIFEPYIEQFQLRDRNLRNSYKNVFVGDIRYFDTSSYDYIILGDVLEHLSREDALVLLQKIKSKKYLIAVPYMFKQGVCFDNVWERHLQPDLTEDIMIQVYGLKKLFGNEEYGYFINY